jgi:ferredoxin-thioredoxin reductase catalytic subunit
VKKLCLCRRTLTEKKKVFRNNNGHVCPFNFKMYDIGWLDLEGCFYLSPSQVSQLLESLSNLTRLLVSARWNRELHLWRKVYESYAKKILCPCFLNYQQLYIYIYMYMYLYVLNSIHWNVNAQKKRKREIESTQNNSSGKINVGIKRYMFRRGNEPQGSNKTYMYMYI